MAKVIKLRVENILGIKSAEAQPNGESVVIGGANGQGKSSLQRALKMALGGKEHVSAEPTHDGAEKGTVFTSLDNGYTVEFSVTKDRKTRLVIKNVNNPGFKSDSVSLLKDLFGDLSFDPGECMSKGAKELAETLMRLAGLDFSELNLARAESFERRTAIGRDERRLAAQLSGLKEHEDAPDSEVSSKAVLDEIQAAQKLLSDETARQGSIAALEAGSKRAASLISDLDRQAEQLRARRADLVAQQEKDAEAVAKLRRKSEAFTAPDVAALKDRLGGVEETNAKVRENQQRAKVEAEHKAAADEYARLTEDLARIDDEKQNKLSAASLPIPGLSFDEAGVRLNGILLDDCSESERWEIATAVAFALNPQNLVFVSQSGGMDKRTRARVIERARTLGVQAFIEVVDDSEDVQILIERGEVKENRLALANRDDGAV